MAQCLFIQILPQYDEPTDQAFWVPVERVKCPDNNFQTQFSHGISFRDVIDGKSLSSLFQILSKYIIQGMKYASKVDMGEVVAKY